MKRIISLWLPTLATDRVARRRGHPGPPERADGPAGRPLVTIAGERGRLVVVGANRAAAGLGIHASMPLADARALFPELEAVDDDPAGDEQTLVRLADWCSRYTPWTAVEAGCAPGTGGLWLDISGCAHLFGGEAALIADLVARFDAFGFAVEAASADTPGAAWAWARHRGADDPVLPSGEAQAALAGLPAAALRLEPEVVETLDRLGLRRVGALYDLPRASLAARFGDIVRRRIDQALGIRDEPISPRRPVAPFIARLAFPEPVTQPADVEAALQRLAETLCERLQAEHLGARRIAFAIHRSDASLGEAVAGTSQPVHDPKHLMELMAPKLELLDPLGLDGLSGVEVAVLALPVIAPFTAAQAALPRIEGGAAGQPHGLLPRTALADPELGALADRLAGRLGGGNVRALALRESHWPERAELTRPLLDGPLHRGSAARSAPPVAKPPRPLRLLHRPEPVEVSARIEVSARVEGTRVPPAFRWRKLTHRIARAEGPERIAPEWWTELGASTATPSRDYYRVEDETGRRYWLFHEGDAGDGEWFVHGCFA